MEDPDLSAPEARIIWSKEADPGVLAIHAEPASPDDPDALDIGQLRVPDISIICGDSAVHMVMGDGRRRLRIDLFGCPPFSGPLRFSYQLFGIVSVEPPLVTLRQLLFLVRHKRFGEQLWPVSAKARDLLILRIHDALMTGASYREIAKAIFGAERTAHAWNGGSDSLKSQIRRLVARARQLAAGEWRGLI